VISLERRDGRPLRIGHRGAAALAPENTLRSFRAALDAEVDLVEFDVFDLDDGELVVAHSNDLYEVSHGAARGTVCDRSLADLRQVCPELPTLEEALTFFSEVASGVGLHVDLKAPSAGPKVVAALGRFGLLERSLISSFHLRGLRELALLEPRVRLGITFPRDRLGIHGRRGFGPAVQGGLRGLRFVTPRFAGTLLGRSSASALVLHHALVSPAVVRRVQARGAAVVAWTVDDPADLARVDAAGVNAVVVNDPGIFVSTLVT
jgi:glycerophosphoryl diester phosphodiesterase